jgi:hypothetical protein
MDEIAHGSAEVDHGLGKAAIVGMERPGDEVTEEEQAELVVVEANLAEGTGDRGWATEVGDLDAVGYLIAGLLSQVL